MKKEKTRYVTRTVLVAKVECKCVDSSTATVVIKSFEVPHPPDSKTELLERIKAGQADYIPFSVENVSRETFLYAMREEEFIKTAERFANRKELNTKEN